MVNTTISSYETWDPDKAAPEVATINAIVPERNVLFIIFSNEDDDDASMSDAEEIFSCTELDSHTNMAVLGKHVYVLAK